MSPLPPALRSLSAAGVAERLRMERVSASFMLLRDIGRRAFERGVVNP